MIDYIKFFGICVVFERANDAYNFLHNWFLKIIKFLHST